MSRDDSVNKMLDVYEQPLINGLTEESPHAQQPPHIKVGLRPHQLAMINAMGDKESVAINGFDVSGETHFSQFAILGDKVGSGKTLMTLGYISSKKSTVTTSTSISDAVFSRVHSSSKTSFWSKKPIYTNECSGNTLIIVPHTLYHQWKHAIQHQTTLSFLEVRTMKAFEKPDFLESIKQRDITLMSNTIIKPFMSETVRSSIQWSRIVFDEVDSIHFTSTVQMPNANFYWLITATWPNFIFQGLYMYMSEAYLNRRAQAGLNSELVALLNTEYNSVGNHYTRYEMRSGPFFSQFLTKHPNRGHIVLRNSDAFMQQSWKSPPILQVRTICEAPAHHRLVSQFVSVEIQELLHAGDVQGALEKLGVNNTSQSSLIAALCDTREKELDRLEKTLIFKESIEYSSPQIKEQAINSLKGKINSLKEQITSLKDRVLNFKNEICAICYEDPKTPTMVMCCSRLFCGICVIECIKRNASCPLCRAALTFQGLRHIDLEKAESLDSKNAIVTPSKPSKKAAIIKLVTESNGKFLVFNRYDNPFLDIEAELLEKGVRVASVRGNKDHISSTLKQFEKGDIKVLLMNSTEAGAGMDLKSATHIVLMHSMRKEEEKQIIGRAIRLGRTEPLTLVRLLHDGESGV